MPEQQIPEGMLVTFKINGDEIPELAGVNLRIQEDIGLTLSSQFDEVFSRGVSNWEKLTSDVIAKSTGYRFSSQFKEFGFQTWRGTAPIDLTLSVTLNMKTDAYTDVIEPTRALCALAIPDDRNLDDKGMGLHIPGPSILSLFSDDKQSGDSTIISCKIGWMNFDSVIVKKAEPIFSKHVDSEGYSIWSTVNLNINSVYTATRQMLDRLTL